MHAQPISGNCVLQRIFLAFVVVQLQKHGSIRIYSKSLTPGIIGNLLNNIDSKSNTLKQNYYGYSRKVTYSNIISTLQYWHDKAHIPTLCNLCHNPFAYIINEKIIR